MPRALKVYGWTGTRQAPGNPQRQSRNIIAARSVADLVRLTGIPRSEYAWTGAEARNPAEVAQAMQRPGIMFWQPLDARDDVWYADEPAGGGDDANG